MKLLTPTNRTTAGPVLSMRGASLTVSYDYESDDGSLVEGELEFTEVIAFRYWDEPTTPSTNVVGGNEIRELAESAYLAEVVDRWAQAVGWQDWQQERGGAGRFKHYTAYFDDAGSIDVVSAACTSKR